MRRAKLRLRKRKGDVRKLSTCYATTFAKVLQELSAADMSRESKSRKVALALPGTHVISGSRRAHSFDKDQWLSEAGNLAIRYPLGSFGHVPMFAPNAFAAIGIWSARHIACRKNAGGARFQEFACDNARL